MPLESTVMQLGSSRSDSNLATSSCVFMPTDEESIVVRAAG